MELMTNEIGSALAVADTDENINREAKDTPIVVKYFNPCGAQTWYISSGTKEGDDWRLYGWCELGFGPGCDELGFVMLSELQSVKGLLGLGIERDLHYGQHMLAEVMH